MYYIYYKIHTRIIDTFTFKFSTLFIYGYIAKWSFETHWHDPYKLFIIKTFRLNQRNAHRKLVEITKTVARSVYSGYLQIDRPDWVLIRQSDIRKHPLSPDYKTESFSDKSFFKNPMETGKNTKLLFGLTVFPRSELTRKMEN